MRKSTYNTLPDSEASACRPWQVPEVSGHATAGATASAAPVAAALATAGQIEEIQRQAWQEAFDEGRREGLEKGLAEARSRVDRLDAILSLLDAPLEALDDRLVEEVCKLSLIIARQIIRREIRTDPAQIMAVIREAAEVLPVGAQTVRLYLNPEDAAIVREISSRDGENGGTWRIQEDPAIARGGCRVETDNSRIDASVEKRLAVVAAQLLGGEREGDDGAHCG